MVDEEIDQEVDEEDLSSDENISEEDALEVEEADSTDELNSPITEPKALRKNLCKFKNCDKSDILERLKNNRSNFFTVYNGYCNLSRFFGYQPAGMERSGMESG